MPDLSRLFPCDVDDGGFMSKAVAILTGLIAYTLLPIVMVIVAFEGALEYVRNAVEEL
jgi:hypothetical protein